MTNINKKYIDSLNYSDKMIFMSIARKMSLLFKLCYFSNKMSDEQFVSRVDIIIRSITIESKGIHNKSAKLLVNYILKYLPHGANSQVFEEEYMYYIIPLIVICFILVIIKTNY